MLPPVAIFGFFDNVAAAEELEFYLFDQVVNNKNEYKNEASYAEVVYY